MISIKDNINALEKAIINYLVSTSTEYELYNENNDIVNRDKLIRLIKPSYFTNPMIEEVFRQMKNFHAEYHKIPNTDEICNYINVKNLDISKADIDVMFDLNLGRFTPEFLYKNLKSFVLVNGLNATLSTVLTHLKTEEISPTNIDEVYDYVRSEINANMDVDLTNENLGLSIKDPTSHIQNIKNTKSTGFPFIDKILGGGWEAKTLIVFAGRPKSGKSLILANIAVRAALQNNNVGVFTVELGDRKYVKRVGSNLYNVNYKEYSKFIDENNISLIKQAIDKTLKEREIGELWIKEYPTGGATVIDIENYFLKLERTLNIKFDLIIIDYVNLLKPADSNATMYERIKKICEEMRKIAIRNKWCVVSATQVKANYFNSDELYLDSPAESSGLVATVDSLFGLTSPPGSPTIKMKNLANRDEGYMDSHKIYRKVKDYFRIVEDTNPGSEFWTDDDGDDLAEEHMRQYTHSSDEIDVLKQEGTKLQEQRERGAASCTDVTIEEVTTETLSNDSVDAGRTVVMNSKIDMSKLHEDILKEVV